MTNLQDSILPVAALLVFGTSMLRAEGTWIEVNQNVAQSARRAATSQRTIVPVKYRTIQFDRRALKEALDAAPGEFSGAPGVRLSLPLPDGTSTLLEVWNSPILAPEEIKKHPELNSYVARSVNHSICGRLTNTPYGFYAALSNAKGDTFYIDPYWRDDSRNSISYRKSDCPNPDKRFTCLLDGDAAQHSRIVNQIVPATGTILRVYRLAIACTGEYSAAAGLGKLAETRASIIVTVDRVNQVFQRELCARLVIVSGNDNLIFTDPQTDGYTNNSGTLMLGENQLKLDALIGDANYDIGHVLSTGGGGVASLASIGVTGAKARGVTGSSNPIGDPFDIDYVAHEMGHQLGANHTFNASTGSCGGGNRNQLTACEPGGGTTIMAYAGICPPQDLANHSSDYFHSISYEEMETNLAVLSNVGTVTPTGNTPPSISPPDSFIIPSGTPFRLTAVATDPDPSANLTYCWEEIDVGGPDQDPTLAPRDNGSSPLFRSFPPIAQETRVFPSLSYILANSNVPPPTVAGFASGEYLPTTDRILNFRVTVRDNQIHGGVQFASTTVRAVAAAGPFAITAPNKRTVLDGEIPTEIKWSVANSNIAPINCAEVKITLSIDGGSTFPYVLAERTPNSGKALVTFPVVVNSPESPTVLTKRGRIKIESLGNIFFDISDSDLLITRTGWTITSTNFTPSEIIKGKGRYLTKAGTTITGERRVAYSDDLFNWNTGTGVSEGFKDLAFQNGIFCGLDPLGNVFRSVDGREWNLSFYLPPLEGFGWIGVPSLSGGNGHFLLIGGGVPRQMGPGGINIPASQQVLSSVDGSSWMDLGNTIPFLSAGDPASNIVGIGKGIVNFLRFSNGMFLGVGDGEVRGLNVQVSYLEDFYSRGTILGSADGVSWNRHTPALFPQSLNGVPPASPMSVKGFNLCNGTFFLFPDSYYATTYCVMKSVDGANWTAAYLPDGFVSHNEMSICFGSGEYLLVGNGTNDIWHSEDGLVWRPEGIDLAALGVANGALESTWYEDGRFYIFGRIPFSFVLTRKVKHPSEFAHWVAAMFNAEERNDPAVSGAFAAPAGDGVANLLKFAFGLSPHRNESALSLLHVFPKMPWSPSNNIVFEFSRPRGVSESVAYVIEATRSLSSPNWLPITAVEEVDPPDLPLDALRETVRFTEASPSPEDSRFYRLRMSLR